jgi:hypothetical protein
MSSLTLKQAPIGRNQDDFDVLEHGVVVGRIFLSPSAPQDRQWMWGSGHNDEIARGRTDTSQRARPRWRRSLRAGAEASHRHESPSSGKTAPDDAPRAHGRVHPRLWANPVQAKGRISLGEVQNSRGICRGDNREPLKRTFWACVTQLKITALLLI